MTSVRASLSTILVILAVMVGAPVGPLAAQGGTTSNRVPVTSPPRSPDPVGSFVTRDGIQLRLNDGPFYHAGWNTYYLMVWSADPLLVPDVDEVLSEGESMGLRTLRTWAFNDGASQWHALQTAPGVYQEYVFQGLDYVVWQAGERGLKLVLALVNNWDDYGGMNQYVSWSSTASQHDDFYTDPSCRQWYKDHARAVIERVNVFTGRVYRDDSTVMAWELANEPRCSSDASGDTLQAWVEEMSAYVKSLDGRHLVTTGSEGFFAGAQSVLNPRSWMSQQGVDFVRNHSPSTVDFATTHLWPDHWGTTLTESRAWITDHVDEAQVTLSKPVIVEEFGKARPVSTRDTWFQAFYDDVFASASTSGAAAGSNLWILYHDTYPDYDGFGVYFPQDVSTVTIIQAEAARMNGL